MHSTQSVSLRSFVYGHFQPIPLTKYLNFFSHSQLEWLTHIQSKYWKWTNMQILNGFWLVLDVSVRTPFTHPNTEKPLSNCRNWISNGNNNSCPLAILCQWCLCFYLFSGVFFLVTFRQMKTSVRSSFFRKRDNFWWPLWNCVPCFFLLFCLILFIERTH